jgi:hypothetical protein
MIHIWENEAGAGASESTRLLVLDRTSFPKLEIALQYLTAGANAGFCDLSSADSRSILKRLQNLNEASQSLLGQVSIDGRFNFVRSRPEGGDYLGLSRAVFNSNRTVAFVGIDISGLSGAIVMLRKSDSQWEFDRECVEWISWK